MALKAVNIGEREILKKIVGDTGDTLWLRLFDNDVTPAEGDTNNTYSESDGSGYTQIGLKGDSWTISTEAGDTTHADYAQQTFTYSGGDTLYGYYVMEKSGYEGDSVVLMAEKFTDGPYTIPGGGGTVKITPKIQLD